MKTETFWKLIDKTDILHLHEADYWTSSFSTANRDDAPAKREMSIALPYGWDGHSMAIVGVITHQDIKRASWDGKNKVSFVNGDKYTTIHLCRSIPAHYGVDL